MILDGPMGPFEVPDEPANTRDHVLWLTQGVWGGEYEHPEIPTTGIRRVLDLGACCGAFAVWAQRKWGSDIEIDCYDPHAAPLEFLRRNAPAARVHEVAVTTLEHPILCVHWDWGSASVYQQNEGVSVTPMHPRELPPCDVLKVDAEGVEVEVLSEYLHLASVQVLLYEFHHADHRGVLHGMAERAGFRCLREEQTMTYGPSLWVR